MSKSKKYVLILILILGCFYFYYSSVFSSQFFVGKLLNINGKNVDFQKEQGELITIKVPSIIIPLLNENERYSVVVYDNIFRPPFLVEIKQMNK